MNAAQASFNTTTAKQIHSYNPDFKIVHYHNTGPTNDIYSAEYNKSNVLRYPFATLTSPLTNSVSDTIINLKLLSSFSKIPLTASTTNDTYSSNCQHHVSWIRIDNEYMKVIKINSDTNKLTVSRAFIGNGESNANNTISAHAVNSKIFSAVYNAAPPGINGCTDIRYAINPESQYAVTQYANYTATDILQNGADGSWYDTFGGSSFKAVDGLGHSLDDNHIWDDLRDDYYGDCNNYRIAQQNRLTAIYDELSRKYKLEPNKVTIYANNMSPGNYNNCGCGKFLQQNPGLDGYCQEGYALHETGNCKQSEIVWSSLSDWKDHVNVLINASSLSLAAMPMIAQAGCKSPALEKLNETLYQQVITFGYVSFLIGVKSMNCGAMFGIPPLRMDQKNVSYAYIDSVFYYKIGNPIQSKTNVDEYLIGNGHISYQREFENGIVIINPNNITDKDIELRNEYINPETNKTVKNLNVDGHTGYILLDI